MITTVDIGGTKTLVASFGEDGKPKNQVKFPTPPEKEEFIIELTKHLEAFAPIKVLSIGIPGVVHDGVVNPNSNLVWEHWPLQKILEQKYQCPVYIQNDATMAALAEINALETRPHIGLYLTVSTGIGAGVILDGKLPNPEMPTEFGLMTLEYKGQWQTWEQLASGKALFKHFGKLADQLTEPEEWEWLADRLAIGLALLIPALEPNAIVFGGGVGEHLEQFKQPLARILANKPLPPVPHYTMTAAHYPKESVIYGCYYYATHSQSR